MMENETLDILLRLACASTLAVFAVLLLRGLLRERFGAHVAYLIWMLVPVSMAVALLPAPTIVAPPQLLPAPLSSLGTTFVTAPIATSSPLDFNACALAAWLAGTALCGAALSRQQRRFVRRLGKLVAAGERVWRANGIASCPALVGAWQPRIVLPRDFELRYTDTERVLILAHERMHVARGDAQVNLFVAMLRCLFWFNPLLHFAASRFRFDQELACDAAVITRFPEARRSYADAMLKTQLADVGLPVGCNWQSSHPLKERISMLKSRLPSPRRKRIGIALSALFVVSVAAVAWAEQPARGVAPPDPSIDAIETRLSIKIDGHNLDGWSFNGDGHDHAISNWGDASGFNFFPRHGRSFAFTLNKGSETWHVIATPSQFGDGSMEIAAVISHNGAEFAHPTLVSGNGQAGAIKIGEEQADGSFKGFEAQITMTKAVTTSTGGIAVVDHHATYRSISRIVYPAAQAKAGIGGTVFVLAHVGIDGHVVSTGLKAGPGAGADVYPLISAALQGVQNWTFNPADRNGKAVPSDEIVPIVFKGAQPLNSPKIEGALDPIEVQSTSAVLAEGDYTGPTENVEFRKMHPPKYPIAAIAAKQTGHIVLKVLVSAAGEPESAEVYDANPPDAVQAFADSSIAAVMQWRFNPGVRDSKSVPGYVLIPFDYNLTED